MNLRRTYHAYWFIIPTVWWQPRTVLFGGAIGWSIVLWWLRWGIELHENSQSDALEKQGEGP